MNTKTLTPTQLHLLRTFSYDGREEYAREVQEVLTRHFQKELDKEIDRLWDEGVLSDEILDKMMEEDFHAKG
jgi:hypothetical protein